MGGSQRLTKHPRRPNLPPEDFKTHHRTNRQAAGALYYWRLRNLLRQDGRSSSGAGDVPEGSSETVLGVTRASEA